MAANLPHLPQDLAHTHAIFLRHRLRHCPSGACSYLHNFVPTSATSYLAQLFLWHSHRLPEENRRTWRTPSSSAKGYVIVHLEHVHTCTTSFLLVPRHTSTSYLRKTMAPTHTHTPTSNITFTTYHPPTLPP